MASSRKKMKAPTMAVDVSEDDAVVDSELIPSSLASLAPVLRVANDIQNENPRVAYLCRFYVFDKARHMDPTSSGRGVSQFKTYLLGRLERESETENVLARNDPREIIIFYQNFYEKSIRDGEFTQRPEEMAKNCQMATVLYDVLRTVVPSQKIDEKTLRYAQEVTRKSDQFTHYNILPLLALNVKPAIMELPEIKAAICALRNVANLPMPRTCEFVGDILDWVSSIFGFQKSNVENQREHLILLLANIDVRRKNPENFVQLSSSTIRALMTKILKNYSSWCNYLRCSSSLCFPPRIFDREQVELIYIALYLLIWGEASSIRFMPECLCYIFHNMSRELGVVLMSQAPLSYGTVFQIESRDDEYFLRNVIVPIFDVLKKEASRSKGGRASYSKWRNYDDLNEIFWSHECFRLGWPMNLQDFFRNPSAVNSPKKEIKTNFVEVRTFMHLYRNFDRMWKFFILAFQAMVIVAWKSSGSITACFEADVFKSISSIFVTSSVLNLLHASLDMVLSIKAWKSLKFSHIMRYLLRFMVASLWAVIMPGFYFHGFWGKQSYNYAVAIYLIPNALSALVFLIPSLRKALERSNWRIIVLILWWDQTVLYIGRGLYEDKLTVLKYALFWIVLLISKLGFSYYFEILPLVSPTKVISEMSFDNYEWHEFFPHASRNIAVIIAIWAPIVLVYFLDTQIWFAIYSTLFSGIQGALSNLGEIKTLGTLRSRFEGVSLAFSRYLMPSTSMRTEKKTLSPDVGSHITNFSIMWNKFISSMRSEDLLSNRDRDLLLFPRCSHGISVVQWPPYLLANKISIALNIAKDFKGNNDKELLKEFKNNDYMESAIIEFYEMLRDVIHNLLKDEGDKMIVTRICKEIVESLGTHRFLNNFRISGLLPLCKRLKAFFELLLSNDEEDDNFRFRILTVLQDVVEIVTWDVMTNGHEILDTVDHHNVDGRYAKKTLRFSHINMGVRHDITWKEKVFRLHLLLTVDESTINEPQNLEAQRRITFFANSLFMKMPLAPELRNMLSFSVLTPYYKEDVLYTEEELNKENEDGISVLFYLKKIYPDEWKNFMERISDAETNTDHKIRKELTRQWASCRAQTLHRTVRGMMSYRQALEFQCFLESGCNENLSNDINQEAFHERARALADLKFTYVVSCMVYGLQKKSSDHRDQACYSNILKLMLLYPSMRVAYIDSREEMVNGRLEMVYYSVLVKGGYKLDEEIYRIKLPGSPTMIGEARPENQNNAIIFTRGEALQTIDMNQDNYFEEAFKMRNIMEEFIKPRGGGRKPTILGLREHIFTGRVSSPSMFMSSQETNVISVGKRILANPLRVRFHYGHPDIFDRIFHITRGGISKASRGLNSIDIFAGYNSTLRGGLVTYHEYIQVGKGCELNMNIISTIEAKVAADNGEQTLTRDVYRLGCRFDFFRLLSFYFTTVGVYVSCMITVLTVYVFLYGRLYMVMSGANGVIQKNLTVRRAEALEQALATQSLAQFGLLSMLPMTMEIGLEKGFRDATGDFIIMQLQLASVFFAFQLGTKAHYYGIKILHGGFKYRAIGRGLVVYHVTFAHNYRLYSRSHFVKGLEIFILLIVYEVYGESRRGSSLYLFITFSMWFIVVSWLYAPFVFNPSGFDLQKTVIDWKDWKRWMGSRGGIGISSESSWESWWDGEREHLKHTNFRGRLLEIFLACRFFVYQYGIVYHLDISRRSTSLQVYGLSWAFVATVLLALKMVSFAKHRFGLELQLVHRILKAILFVSFVSVMAVLFVVSSLSISDIFVSILAFLPTVWAIVLASAAIIKGIGLWESIVELAKVCEHIMGLVIFIPIAILSVFPFVSEIQTRLLFNQAISRGLDIPTILAGRINMPKKPAS